VIYSLYFSKLVLAPKELKNWNMINILSGGEGEGESEKIKDTKNKWR
jgi:hypothetical protein